MSKKVSPSSTTYDNEVTQDDTFFDIEKKNATFLLIVHMKKAKVSPVLPTINASCIIKKKIRTRVLGPAVLHHTWSKKHN